MSNKYKNVDWKPSGLELKDRLVSVNRVTKVKGGRARFLHCSCR
jgi:small subunit ribosomal protein S5